MAEKILSLIDLRVRINNKVKQANKRLKNALMLFDIFGSDKYFITLTFDPKKVNSNDPLSVVSYLRLFFNNLRRRAAYLDLYYYIVLVPDFKSESQGIHFHGIITSDNIFKLGKCTFFKDNIYNIDLWSYGYTTIEKCYDFCERVVNYIKKYTLKYRERMLLPKYFYKSSKNVEKLLYINGLFR